MKNGLKPKGKYHKHTHPWSYKPKLSGLIEWGSSESEEFWEGKNGRSKSKLVPPSKKHDSNGAKQSKKNPKKPK